MTIMDAISSAESEHAVYFLVVGRGRPRLGSLGGPRIGRAALVGVSPQAVEKR